GSAPSSGLSTVSTIWAFDPRRVRLLVAGHLQEPVSNAGAAVVGSRAWVVGGELNGSPVAAVQMLRPDPTFGSAGIAGAGSPYFGTNLLVADRGNNQLLLFNPALRTIWTYPSPSSPPNPSGFFFPDDAFFVHNGKAIITNQEENETIEEIGYPSGKLLWTYGHPRQLGSAAGFLHEPDDAYLLRNGQITVADADNCRVLVINPNGTLAHQIGTTGNCVHQPPTSMGSPNGDTPLADGNLLVSEITGSWVSEYTSAGSLVWTVQLPISYPSDPQQLASDLYLLADYAQPGQLLEFNRAGQISWRYDVTSGPGMLNHPSLAERLPNGVIMLNDDYGDRMVAIDPVTQALVWQYGVTGQPGKTAGMLNTPDGFDVLAPGGHTPTHPATG
ncbi:MAG: PQQ-binding-like beta-propeller repeat protein, partial [Acidimicrobiales bacterium]